MFATITISSKSFKAELTRPYDISLAVSKSGVTAFHIQAPVIEPFRMGNFVGAVSQGGSCNVNNIRFNPHGNCTHTETVGHISENKFFVSDMKEYLFPAVLVTVSPVESNGDKVINSSLFDFVPFSNGFKALIIRTNPNEKEKRSKDYSGTNPPYITAELAQKLREAGVEHLLLDIPSIDKEDDGGLLSAHHAFWDYPDNPRKDATITELIYVDNSIPDGYYLLSLQPASFENDAAPSRPVIYPLIS